MRNYRYQRRLQNDQIHGIPQDETVVVVTHRIITQSGDRIITQSGDYLRTQQDNP